MGAASDPAILDTEGHRFGQEGTQKGRSRWEPTGALPFLHVTSPLCPLSSKSVSLGV
jgi:hypothetical protein